MVSFQSFSNPANVIQGVILDNDAGIMTIPRAPKAIDGGSVTCAAVNPIGGIQRTANITLTT